MNPLNDLRAALADYDVLTRAYELVNLRAVVDDALLPRLQQLIAHREAVFVRICQCLDVYFGSQP